MSNPVIFFIREHLNGYVILVIIFLFIYFAYLRRKYQKESFQAYVEEQNMMGLSKYRDYRKLGENIDKNTRKDFINKYSPIKKLHKKNKESAIKIKYLKDQEKQMQKNYKNFIKKDTEFNKQLLKKDVKQNLKNIKLNTKSFKNNSKQIERFQNNNSNNSNKSNKSNNSNNSNNSKTLNLEFVDSPISLTTQKMKKINNYIETQIETKLETSFDNINITNLSIGEFNKQYDEVINKNSKLIMDYMYDEIITRKRDLEQLITIENNKRIFYNTNINNQINKYLKNKVKDYINNKIDYINSNLTSNINEFNKEYSNKDSKLNNINKLKDKLNISLNQYQYINGKKMNNNTIQDTLNKLQKMNIQPKYESQYDINNSLIEQQFNNDESVLAKRYGQAYQDYIDNEKQERMLVDPGELLSNLEESAISLTEGINTIFSSSQVKEKATVEPFIENSNENEKFVNSMNRFDKFNNPDEFGTYLHKNHKIPTKLYKTDSLPKNSNLDINEGFENINKKNSKLDNKNHLKKLVNREKFNDNKSDDDNGLLDKIMGGDFINGFLSYSLDMGNKFMNNYDHKFDELGNLLDKKDNMMTLGLGLIILSVVLYLADITSSSKCPKCD